MQMQSQPNQVFMPVVIPDDVPVYKILDGKFFADDELYEPGSLISWEEEPNLEMQPMNKLARRRMKEYVAKLDELGRAVAEKTGKAYISMAVSAFENASELAHQDGRRVNLLNGKKEVPIMGGQRRTKKARMITATEESDVPLIDSDNKHSLNSAKTVNDAVGKKM